MKRYPKYKDSGVSWIGEIPEHWEVSHLRKYLKLISVKGHGSEQLLSVTREQGVIVRNVDSKEENHNFVPDDLNGYKFVEEGQFVINKMKSWQGSYGVSLFRGIASPAYFVCDLDFRNKEFFNIAIRSKAYVPFFTQYSKGIRVDQWDLSPIALKNIPFIAPPVEEQSAIVSYLDKKSAQIDRFIASTEAEIEALKELKQAEIARLVTRGVNPDVPMKDSGIAWIGEIPEYWEVRRIKWLFKEEDTRNIDLKYELLSFSRSKGIVPFSEINEKEPSANDLSKYKVIKPGQLLENRMQAWSGMFGCSHIEGCVSPDYAVFSAANDEVNVEYYATLFRTKLYIQQFANASRGVGDGFNRLYTPAFGAIYAHFPPAEEQQAIVDEINFRSSKIDLMVSKLNDQISHLKELKQRIISDAVTGKIDVSLSPALPSRGER
ncbi:MAG: restriction endonuclease subunit S [Bacteroidota bacterium]|nr:restriction endonuclease subunit S [Bacteroidota bacterium]